jgi:hypothetical protein
MIDFMKQKNNLAKVGGAGQNQRETFARLCFNKESTT